MKVDKKNRILEATITLIPDHGFHGTPMSLIAKEAGLAAGTLYIYFPSKEQLLAQAYTYARSKFEASLEYPPDSPNLKRHLHTYFTRVYSWCIQHPAYFRFMEQFANSPFFIQPETKPERPHFTAGLSFLEEGQAIGMFISMPPLLLSNLVYGQVASLAKLHLSHLLVIREPELEAAAQACWNSIRAD